MPQCQTDVILAREEVDIELERCSIRSSISQEIVPDMAPAELENPIAQEILAIHASNISNVIESVNEDTNNIMA